MNVSVVRVIISVYVRVGVHVGFPYLTLMCLCVPLGMYDVFFRVFFSFFPCAGILVFSCLTWRVCYLHEWVCVTAAIGVMPACTLCGDVYTYSAAICWRGVELCVLMFCIAIIRGVEYRILEIKQYFVHLFILLVRAINMEFFKAVYLSTF
jgi:hypothetical protein